MNTQKIGMLEAIALISIVMINHIILNIPKDIISNCGSAAWLNTIYISIIAVFIAWFISFLFKKFENKDILDICEFLGGSYLKYIMGILYIILLILVPAFIIKNFAETLRIIYFKTSPLIYIILFFIIVSTISNTLPLKSLCKTNLILIPLVLLSIIVILFSSIKDFTIQNLFPILGYGTKQTFFVGLSNLFSFSGIGYLFFIGPSLNNFKKFKKISMISIIISGIYLFLSVTCILLALSYVSRSGESFSLYLLTRNIKYSRFLQRVDAIFILIWIISTVSYISIALYFCLYIFKKLTKLKDSNSINFTFNLFIIALLLIPSNFANFINIIQNFTKYGTLSILFGLSLLILIFANIKQTIITKKKGQV